MHYMNYAKLLTLIICICLPLKSDAKPAKESEDSAGIPNEGEAPLLSSPHPPQVSQSLEPQQNSDPDNVDGVDMPIVPHDVGIAGGFPMKNSEGDHKENVNSQGRSSPNGINEVEHSDQLDVNFDNNGVNPSKTSPNDDNKGDIGDKVPGNKPGTALNEATNDDVEQPALPASIRTPQQQNYLPHAADKPKLLDPVDKHSMLPAGVEALQQQTSSPPADKPKSPGPVDPEVSVGNLLTTTLVSPKPLQQVDPKPQETSNIRSETPISIPVSTSSTQSATVSDVNQIEPGIQSGKSDQSNAGQNVFGTENVKTKEMNSSSETGNSASKQSSTLKDGKALANPGIVVGSSSNQTNDETKKTEKDDFSETITQKVTALPETKSTLTTTESSNRKSSTQIASEKERKKETHGTTISMQTLTEMKHPNTEDHTENSLPIDTDSPIATQKPQSTLSVSNIPPEKSPKPPKSTNNSVQLTTSSSSLQLMPTGSLLQDNPLANQSGLSVTPEKANEGITSSKSLATTLTSLKNLTMTVNVSTSLPSPTTTTTSSHLSPTVATKSYTTSGTTPTLSAIPEAVNTSKHPTSVTSSTKHSTTTTTSAKPAVSPAKESPTKPPVKSDASVSQESEHSRKRPSVNVGVGREGGSSIDENPSEVIPPTSTSASVGEASTSSNSTNAQDFLSKMKGMVGDVEPFYIALTLLIMLTLVLITCCCCCKWCSKKRRGIRHRRLKEYGKEKEFLLRDRGKASNYHNDSVTLLQGSSEDEF